MYVESRKMVWMNLFAEQPNSLILRINVMPPCRTGLMLSEMMHIKSLTQWLIFSQCSRSQCSYCYQCLESGCLLLKSQWRSWWKIKFALFLRLATLEVGGTLLIKKANYPLTPPPTDNQWARTCKGEFQECMGRGKSLHAETAQSALSSWTWSCRGLISIILIVLSC